MVLNVTNSLLLRKGVSYVGLWGPYHRLNHFLWWWCKNSGDHAKWTFLVYQPHAMFTNSYTAARQGGVFLIRSDTAHSIHPIIYIDIFYAQPFTHTLPSNSCHEEHGFDFLAHLHTQTRDWILLNSGQHALPQPTSQWQWIFKRSTAYNMAEYVDKNIQAFKLTLNCGRNIKTPVLAKLGFRQWTFLVGGKH